MKLLEQGSGMAQVTKIILNVSLTGKSSQITKIGMPVQWSAIELGKALVDGMVTQGYFAELIYETAELETYRGPLELTGEPDWDAESLPDKGQDTV